MADDDEDTTIEPQAREPIRIGIGYLAFLLVVGLLVLLIAGGLIRL